MSERISLGSIAELKTGPFGTQLHANEYVAEGIPVINVRNIGYGEIIDNDLDMVSRETLSRLSEHTLKENDIVFGRKGSIDRHAFIDNRYDGWMQGSDCIRVRIHDNEINPKYVSHYLKLDSVKKQLINGAVGSTMPSMNTDILKSIVISAPSKEKQDAIEAVFSSIEQKIGINTSICSDLESMAKLLYDYWFVQFDFPDENGRPYKSSGGKMVWNEKLKREIPEGWEVKKLCDVATYVTNKISSSLLSNDTYIGTDNLLANMQGRTLSEYVPTEGYSTAYEGRDILIANIRPYFKKIWHADNSGGASADVLVVRADKELDSWVYSTLARDDFFAYDMAGAKGSKMPRGDKDHIMDYPFAYSNEMAKTFSAKISYINEYRNYIYHENQQLASLRDFLLPMLMNGQVKVADKTSEE